MHHFSSPDSQTVYTIGPCSSADFEWVKHYVKELELDDRDMLPEQFVVAHGTQGLAGFGRVREFSHLSELCSLGVLPGARNKRLGKELFNAMLQKTKQQPYLVCIIPAFFEEFGFSTCQHYPPEMQDKLDYCTGSLAVPEPYVVMTRQGASV